MYLKKNYFEYGASENIKNQSLYASLTGTLKQKKKNYTKLKSSFLFVLRE